MLRGEGAPGAATHNVGPGGWGGQGVERDRAWSLPRRTAHPRHPPVQEAPIRFPSLLGFLAGVLTVVSYLPQAVRAWRTKQTGDLSFGMFALLVGASTAWITYGIITSDAPVIATNAGTLSLNVAILAAKLKYR